MRYAAPLLLLLIFHVPSAPADPDKEAIAILEKAIAAHGGEAKLGKLKIGQIKSHFKGKFGTKEGEMTVVDTFQLPDQFRKDMKGRMNGKDFTMSWAINGKKGWIKTPDGEVKDSSVLKASSDKQFHPLATVAGMVQLKTSANLTTAKNLDIRGKKLIGIRIATDEDEDTSLYFEDERMLLHLLQQRKRLPDYDDKLVLMECFYQEYKEVSGLNLPMRHLVFHDGKPYVEIRVGEVNLPEKVDKQLFEKP